MIVTWSTYFHLCSFSYLSTKIECLKGINGFLSFSFTLKSIIHYHQRFLYFIYFFSCMSEWKNKHWGLIEDFGFRREMFKYLSTQSIFQTKKSFLESFLIKLCLKCSPLCPHYFKLSSCNNWTFTFLLAIKKVLSDLNVKYAPNLSHKLMTKYPMNYFKVFEKWRQKILENEDFRLLLLA